MKKKVALSLLIGLSSLVLNGCSYDRVISWSAQEKGVLVTPEQYSTFVPGQTACLEVERLLGEPSRVQRKGGKELWVYTHHRFNSNPMVTPENSYNAVFLEFDKRGILLKHWRKDVLPDRGE